MNGLTIADGYTQNKVAWAVYAGEILHPRLKILTDHSQATSCRVQWEGRALFSLLQASCRINQLWACTPSFPTLLRNTIRIWAK